jgi:hypothetical protein
MSLSGVRTLPVAPPASAGTLVSYPAIQLRNHPSLERLRIIPSIAEQSASAERLEQTFEEPVTISAEQYVLAGHAQWALALRRGEASLTCLQLNLSAEDAVLWIIQKHQSSASLNDFNRIVLALELEPWFRNKARSNQKLGGERKGSSNLAEPDRCDVRKEVAAAAHVSTGNVTKVKQLVDAAIPEVLEALGSGEITIHCASQCLKAPQGQLEALTSQRDRKLVIPKLNALLNAHARGDAELLGIVDLPRMLRAFSQLPAASSEAVLISEVDVAGNKIFLSKSLMQSLRKQGQLSL